MKFFRKGKKKREMEEKESADNDWPDEIGTDEQSTRIRVNDRRRFNAEPDAAASDEAGAGDAPSLKPKYVEELQARARAAEQKASDVQARFEQVRSELKRETDEMRQRLARTSDERVAREKANFIASLLPFVDNLERAVEAAEGGGTKDALLDGLRGTINGFESALTQAGAEAIEAVGQPFDPEIHEAVDTVEVEPERDGQVTAQYSRGYRMGNQLLRPARVQVGRARGAAQGAGE